MAWTCKLAPSTSQPLSSTQHRIVKYQTDFFRPTVRHADCEANTNSSLKRFVCRRESCIVSSYVHKICFRYIVKQKDHLHNSNPIDCSSSHSRRKINICIGYKGISSGSCSPDTLQAYSCWGNRNGKSWQIPGISTNYLTANRSVKYRQTLYVSLAFCSPDTL